MKDIDYTEVNGYLFPNIKVADTKKVHLTQFGRMKLKYLKEYQGRLYFKLIVTNELNNYLEQVEKEANETYDRLVEEYKKKWNVTEELKKENQMKWVQLMNNIDNVVKQIIMNELIYI